MREKELRLALVCYGGVSLAIYMHGTTKEVWKLARASMRRHQPPGAVLPPASDTEIVYGALLDALAPRLDLRVLVDIVAGASAGGINGILLAQAISQGSDMEPLRELWLEGADSDRLLEPEGAAERFSKLWATPLVRWAERRGLAMEDAADPATRGEVARKLSRLMRSRWFTPPFSGSGFSGVLYDALKAMESGEHTPPLLPPLQPLDLFVTVTDYHGAAETLRLHSPPEITENEHRLVIGFNDAGPGADGTRHLGDIAELAFAARATASFPGAFPPARIGEIDAVVADRSAAWPGRAAFLRRIFPGRTKPEAVTLIDGAVLNSRPFGPAIEALSQRPSHREVDRRFVYVDPKPGMHGQAPDNGPRDSMLLPGFFSTVLRSLADIPRQQPINDNLAAIEALSARVRRLRHVVDGMTPAVDAAIENAIGFRVFMFTPTPERLADWRSRTQAVAAREAGFAYAAYGQLKIAQIVESLSERLAAVGGASIDSVRAGLWRHVHARGLDRAAQGLEKAGAASDYVTFLRSFDLEYRIRRLRFVIRRVNTMAETAVAPADRHSLEVMKAGLYEIVGPHLQRRLPEYHPPDVVAAAAAAAAEPAAALAALAASYALKALDTASDTALVALFAQLATRAQRRGLLSAYLGFAFFDIAMLPLLQGDGVDEFEEIKVDRLSPDDALSLRHLGGARLKGAQLNAFGAFFSRAYREHDYLWGRLHGAERLIDIVASSLPDDAKLPADRLAALKHDAFAAIVDTERRRLTMIPDLLAVLATALGLKDDVPPENAG
ncbi:patatin-like protein [Polymorphobacter fuscus]|uniref:Patatin-like protein n=1 Tax=Sandarakinorhabdus fusca TaxID=1439888 RepID=A0A7C9KJ44_9SPHN|nr:patatin-like protein [Polymorphobacter fuscus]KAB7646550.1 patatin-like protein [Polymorphobacter fuscus]MQT17799.1 patatin-like protein [Polymorphobacter fuscus]NJC09652.1 patatin-related protein [Polymorphobacter fuscus]